MQNEILIEFCVKNINEKIIIKNNKKTVDFCFWLWYKYKLQKTKILNITNALTGRVTPIAHYRELPQGERVV